MCCIIPACCSATEERGPWRSAGARFCSGEQLGVVGAGAWRRRRRARRHCGRGSRRVRSPGRAPVPTPSGSGTTDPLVASLLDRGDVPRVNELLRAGGTTRNPFPPGCRPMCATTSSTPAGPRRGRPRPSWTRRCSSTKRGLYTGMLYGFGSGMLSTAIPNEARRLLLQGAAHMGPHHQDGQARARHRRPERLQARRRHDRHLRQDPHDDAAVRHLLRSRCTGPRRTARSRSRSARPTSWSPGTASPPSAGAR